jgi:hypothetical protein
MIMTSPEVRVNNQQVKRTTHYITDVFDTGFGGAPPPMSDAVGGIMIKLLSASGTLLAEYPVTSEGLTYALSDAVATNIVELPACSITGNFVVGGGVALTGLSRTASVIVGSLSLGDLSSLSMLKVINIGSDSEDPVVAIYGADVPGLSVMYNVMARAENDDGVAAALYLSCGSVNAIETELLAQVGDGGYATFVEFGVFIHYSGRAVGTVEGLPYWLET